ncbi:hypothetical protein CEXT_480371 [Caerostris extrusa]|uniref:Uncharacterized protein n=1 Tax=Caerostris extrusa TaxID=172846 RepID=A0AAV4XHC6_CAEEX|nr:hypothetical protein CEXT_480371 [Caerostris extrusa]
MQCTLSQKGTLFQTHHEAQEKKEKKRKDQEQEKKANVDVISLGIFLIRPPEREHPTLMEIDDLRDWESEAGKRGKNANESSPPFRKRIESPLHQK